ncbi:DUF748 domain-containing protein [Ottowia thiooxydans]|uniref:DUF748 domain-containing protein n=1 Tax=Ottowia thiooxydans TaxID=219182 RepID=A0ABV2QFU8_9BURK
MDNPLLMEENGAHPKPQPPVKRFLANRWARRAVYLLGTLLTLWILAWLALPPLAKWQGEKIASEQLGRKVSIGSIDFKPWSLELTLRDLALASADGKTQQLTVKRVYADGELESLWRLAPVVDAIQIEEPVLRVAHQGEGRYDFDDILARLAAQPKKEDDGKPARFAFYNIDLKGGTLDFDDRAVGQKHEVRDLQLVLPFISNLPSQREIKVLPHLAFVANGSRFDSTAQTLPFTDSRQTDAVFRLAKLDLSPYLGYIPSSLPVPLRLKAAMVDAELTLGFEQTPKPSLRLGGNFQVSGLKSVDTKGADALTFDALKVELADVRPLEQRVHLASVELNGPRVVVHRDKQGQINLLVSTSEETGSKTIAKGEVVTVAAAPKDPQGRAAPGWQVSIDKLAVHGGTAAFTDETTAEGASSAATLQFDKFELAVESVGYPFAKPLSFRGSAALVGAEGLTPLLAQARTAVGGRQSKSPAAEVARGAPTLAFEGTATDRVADVSTRIEHVPVALAAPYLAQIIHPRLTGSLDAQLALHWAAPMAADLPANLKLKAERVALNNLSLTESNSARASAPKNERPRTSRTNARRDSLASVRQIEVVDAEVDLRTRVARVGKLSIGEPSMDVERGSDKRWMFESWLRQTTESSAAPATTGKAKASGNPPPGAPWKFAIDEFSLSGGTVGWRDAATTRPVRAELTRLKLEARQLSLDSGKPMPVTLSTQLGAGRAEPGSISWRGTVGLTPIAANGAVDAQRLPVHAFEPYFDDAINLDILRADASFKGQVAYSDTAQGPRLKLNGDALLEELRTHSRPNSTLDAGAAPADATATARSASGSAPALTAPPPSSRGAESGRPAGEMTASQALVAPSAVRTSTGSSRTNVLGEELLSWKLLRLAGLDVALEPGKAPRVEVKNTLLSDFYARLIIDPNGRINLQDLLKSGASDAPASATSTRSGAGSPVNGMPASGEFSAGGGASASPAASSATSAAAATDPNAPVILFGPVELVNGKVLFSDRFIRPNYSADLTELNGSLSAFSSIAPAGAPQMADLKIVGRAEGSAALEVTGKLNPLAKPLALDIKGKVSDLELPPLTPYSVKYAGHGIERGKLSVDVSYAVQPDGRLTATNRLVLNQLQFGEPVPGAPASLPVKLATALLADSNGVIDLDLPISGSLNDPQFSLGPIIFKAVVNLIGRAITAPFTLLARALGGGAGGDDLAQVPFAQGSAALNAETRARLDKVAKALNDRPALKLTVVGTASLSVESDAWRRERLKALVAAEKRSEGGGGTVGQGAQGGSAPSATEKALPAASAASAAERAVGESDYPVLLKRVYRRADLPNKPRNALGFAKDVSVAEMEALLLAHIDVGEDAMRQLAVQRGVAVKDYLASKKLPTDRLFLGAARTGGAATEGATPAASEAGAQGAAAKWAPHAELNLSAK